MLYLQTQRWLLNTSAILTLLFLACVVGIIVTINILFYGITYFFDLIMLMDRQPAMHWHLHIALTFIILSFMAAGFISSMLLLTSGGASVARECGGRELSDDDNDYYSRRLRNVVEEIAIATGIPVPRIFVMNNDDGINAFAAGCSEHDAAISVTKGALEKLNRDELQAVIAHEFSHILHKDISLNTKLIAFNSAITALAKPSEFLNPTNHDSIAALLLLPLVPLTILFMPVGLIGLMYSNLLKLCINRKREYLADASAVQYTRLNTGLIGALKKIGGLTVVREASVKADTEMVSHMMFNSESLLNMLATHPPITKRIKAIDPDFSIEELNKLRLTYSANPPNGMDEDRILGLCESDKNQVDDKENNDSVNNTIEYNHAKTIISNIPVTVLQMARNSYGAIPVLYALLYSSNVATRAKQVSIITAHYNEMMPVTINTVYEETSKMDTSLRLPLAAICFPVINKKPQSELTKLINVTQQLIHADNNISLRNYCLGRMLTTQINDAIHPMQTNQFGSLTPNGATKETACLLSILAQAGNADIKEATLTYEKGMSQLLPGINIAYEHHHDLAAALDPIWIPLNNLNPNSKKLLIDAMNLMMNKDNKITLSEAELIRTVCNIIHHPLPLTLTMGA